MLVHRSMWDKIELVSVEGLILLIDICYGSHYENIPFTVRVRLKRDLGWHAQLLLVVFIRIHTSTSSISLLTL